MLIQIKAVASAAFYKRRRFGQVCGGLMLSLVVRILLLVAAAVTSWLVVDGAPRFGAVQMTVAVLLFVAIVAVLAFWPKPWWHRIGRR